MNRQTLDEVTKQIAYHNQRITELLSELNGSLPDTVGVSATSKPRNVQDIPSVRTWVEWLSENQPAMRKDIADATGKVLTIAAAKKVLVWKPHMEDWDDSQLPGDTLMSIPALPDGKGRPPHIYFLWSQRYELLGLFGVGPDPADGPRDPMLGVVQPPPLGISPDLPMDPSPIASPNIPADFPYGTPKWMEEDVTIVTDENGWDQTVIPGLTEETT